MKNSSSQITTLEWLRVLENDPDLHKIEGYQNTPSAVFADELERKGPRLDWYQGNLDCKFPSGRMILKMIQIARKFGAMTMNCMKKDLPL